MKKILLYILGTVFIMILWAGGVFLVTVNGWLHKPIAKQNTSQSFVEAIEKEIDKQFVGNFAMATFKDGIVEYEKFHSAGKPLFKTSNALCLKCQSLFSLLLRKT